MKTPRITQEAIDHYDAILRTARAYDGLLTPKETADMLLILLAFRMAEKSQTMIDCTVRAYDLLVSTKADARVTRAWGEQK